MNLDKLGPKKFLSLVSIPLLFFCIIALALANDKTSFESPLLLALLNTIFLGLIPFIVSLVAYRTFRQNGSLSILLLGAGILAFSVGSTIAGWANGLPDGSNLTVTIHNTSVLIGSLFTLAAIVLVITGDGKKEPKPGTLPLMLYAGIVAFTIFFSLAAVEGVIPPFFPQSGPTVLRQVILSSATELYAVSALLFGILYLKKKEEIFFWFSTSFALISVGLFAVFIQPGVGSLIGWAGRMCQYAGACLLLIAILAIWKEAKQSGISLTSRIGESFGGYGVIQSILSATDESIWLFGKDGTILMANDTAAKRFGKDPDEMIGHNLTEFLSPVLAQKRMDKLSEVVRTRQPVRFIDERDATIFEHSFYPVFDAGGLVTGVSSFSRDITERRRAEENLRESERRDRERAEELAALLDAVPTPIIITYDPGCTHITGNRAANELLKMPGGGEISLTAPTERRPRHYKAIKEGRELRLDELPIRRAAKGEDVQHFEYTLAFDDGTTRELVAYGSPMRDSRGNPRGAVHTLVDITDRILAETALRESETKYRNLFDNMAGEVHFWQLVRDNAGNIRTWRLVDANPASLKSWGKTREETIGRTADEIFPSATAHFMPIVEKIFTEGRPCSWETYFPDLDQYLRMTSVPFGDFFITTGEDLTTIMKIEEELRQNQITLQTFYDGAPFMMGITELDGDTSVLVSGNRVLSDFFGKERRDMYGHHSTELGTPEQIERLWVENYHRCMEQGTPVQFDLQYPHTGSEKWFRATVAFNTMGPSGKPRFCFVTEDITEKKLAETALLRKNTELNLLVSELTATEEKLRQANEELSLREKELSQSLAEKEVLLSEVHHRVKNNLASFISLLSLKGSTEDTAAGVMLKQDLKNRARSMALIHETLYRTNKFDRVDMHTYLETLVNQVSQTFKTEKTVQIDLDARDVMMDLPRATPLGLIVNELVTNSFKYAFPASFNIQKIRDRLPTIAINLKKEKGNYILSYRDNGVGLPRDIDIGKIQSLGLKLVNFLARHQLHATVEVNSESGTEFIFRFPENGR